MFHEFLPTDYETPKTNSNYLKFEDGDNKIRILSRPIMGWEDWDNSKPIRYKMHQKPLNPIDPERPIKHFWSMIVWDYDLLKKGKSKSEPKIKIWTVNQATIITNLGQIVKDPEWGAPYHYDIKINKTGKDMRTKYLVNACPHKPVSDEIIQAFNAKPICLDVIFDNGDPFAPWDRKTEGCFDFTAPVSESGTVINADQFKEIMEYIGDDKKYLSTLTSNLLKHFNCTSLDKLPASKFDAILKSVKLHSKESLEREMTKRLEEILPF